MVEDFNSAPKAAIESAAVIDTNLDSFRVLPANLRSSSKYDWANPAVRNTAPHSGQAAAPLTLETVGRKTFRGARGVYGPDGFARSRPVHNSSIPQSGIGFGDSASRTGPSSSRSDTGQKASSSSHYQSSSSSSVGTRTCSKNSSASSRSITKL